MENSWVQYPTDTGVYTMRQITILVGIIFSLLLSVGCADIQYYNQSTFGVYEKEIINRWGTPTNRATLEDDRQLLTWIHDSGCKKTAVISKTRKVEVATAKGTCSQR